MIFSAGDGLPHPPAGLNRRDIGKEIIVMAYGLTTRMFLDSLTARRLGAASSAAGSSARAWNSLKPEQRLAAVSRALKNAA